jgi:hypothetical protein
MIPDTFFEQTKDTPGSTRDLTSVLNATKLYIKTLLSDKKDLQEELANAEGGAKNVSEDAEHGSDYGSGSEGEDAEDDNKGVENVTNETSEKVGNRQEVRRSKRILQSQGKELETLDSDTDSPLKDVPRGSAALHNPRLRKKPVHQWPSTLDDDGTLPPTPPPDVSPYDARLRQAVERFIALAKEDVMGNQGVLQEKQVNRFNQIHDYVVEMVDEMREG